MSLTRLGLFALALATLMHAPTASAGDKEVCATSYENAQRWQRRGALLAARRSLLICLRECSDVARPECAQWLDQVERAIPSIVVSVKRHDGTDVADAMVVLEHGAIAVDGRAMELDPGPHEVVVQAEGQRVAQPIVLREGERGRTVVVTLKGPAGPEPTATEPALPTPVAPTRKRIPPASWVLGGVALAGFGTFAGFALYGNDGYATLERCRPGCPPDDVSSVQSRYVVADVALGVGIVALVAAAVTYALQPAY